MDKQKVIEAYRRGLITLQECGQIIGAEQKQLDDLVRTGYHGSQSRSHPLFLVDHL
ncbi:hypothetical protein ACAF76_011985 [Brevibacillus sp. TJ4]|uniref:hypothetical protein n=1 Tax=Brevibacillus sp. TJ4 TaxID=3234853 RepID=UPI0037D3E732